MDMAELTLYRIELEARVLELERVFKDWIPRGGEESFNLYERYRDSGYVALPFAGGFVDQQTWWQEDVRNFELISEKHRIPGLIQRIDARLKQLAETKGRF